MFAPFDPDPDCPWCHGKGFKRNVMPGREVIGRCECTNWSSYAKLRRAKGLTMQQAMDELRDELNMKDDDPDACPF